jgi:hypothetical protein
MLRFLNKNWDVLRRKDYKEVQAKTMVAVSKSIPVNL